MEPYPCTVQTKSGCADLFSIFFAQVTNKHVYGPVGAPRFDGNEIQKFLPPEDLIRVRCQVAHGPEFHLAYIFLGEYTAFDCYSRSAKGVGRGLTL